VQDIAAALGSSGLFDGVAEQTITTLAGRCSLRRYRRGQPVFFEGDPGDALFVVAAGAVKLYLMSPDGDEVLIDVVRPHRILGELSALDQQPRSTSAEVMEAATLVVIPAADLVAAMRADAALAEQLVRLLAATLRRVTTRMSDLVFLDLPARLAKLLVMLAETQGVDGGASVTVTLALTQSDLAHMIGATRQALNTALGGFERRGLLTRNGTSLCIHDLEQLRRRAAG
jgi:CRP-like cAMP-binding protein